MRGFLLTLAALLLAIPAAAAVKPFPASFQTRDVQTGPGLFIHVRVGGHGPAVVMLHGFGDSGDMWEPLAAVMGQGPHGGGPRSAWLRPLGPSRERF